MRSGKKGRVRFLCFGVLLAFGLTASLGETVKVGVYDNPPKIFVDPASGEPSGFFADVLREIALRNGWDLEWKSGDWSTLLKGVETGEIDLLPDVARLPDRQKSMVFSNEVALSNWTSFFTRKEDPRLISLHDLEGKRIGVLRGSVQVPELQDSVEILGLSATFVAADDYRQIFDMLAAGEVDVAVSNYSAGNWLMKEFPGTRDNPVVIQPVGLYFAASRQSAERLIPVIDSELRRLKMAEGSMYHASLSKWIHPPEDDSGALWIKTGPWLVGVAVLGGLILLVFRYQLKGRTAELAERVEELKEARNQAVASSQAKTEFLAVMNHELRTPLNAIIGPSELLMEQVEAPAARKMLAMIRNSAHHLLGLISDILDLSQIERGKISPNPKPIRVQDFLEESLEPMVEIGGRKGLKLEYRMAKGCPDTVQIDPILVRQVLLNLVQNGIRNTHRGYVSVDTSWIPSEGADNEGTVRFVVTDTGEGITPAMKEKIFQAFEKVDQSVHHRQEGVGLGLTVSRAIAGMLDGELILAKSSSDGSEFEFSFPSIAIPEKKRKSGVEGSMTSESVQAPPLDPKERPLLLVEDDPNNIMVLQMMLKRLGHECDLAESGEEALESVAETDYRLILLDIRLPGIDGIEVAKQIRNQVGRKQPRIVALTAHAMSEQRDLCLGVGMDDFVTKPVSMERLREVLRKQSNPC